MITGHWSDPQHCPVLDPHPTQKLILVCAVGPLLQGERLAFGPTLALHRCVGMLRQCRPLSAIESPQECAIREIQQDTGLVVGRQLVSDGRRLAQGERVRGIDHQALFRAWLRRTR